MEDFVGQAYRRGADEQPPAALDVMIEKAARERLVNNTKIDWSVWAIPVALALIAIVGIDVTLEVIDQEDTKWEFEDRSIPARSSGPAQADRAAANQGPTSTGAASRGLAAGHSAVVDRQHAAGGGDAKSAGEAPAAEDDRRARAIAEEMHDRPAEVWLEQIRELVRSGNLADARLEVERFRSIYHGYPIPRELREGLRGSHAEREPARK